MPARARPGAGLVVLAVSSLGVAFFLAWGLVTPPLDEVWRMQIEMGLRGVEPLTAREFRLLQATLRRYPALADNMLAEDVAGLVSPHQDGVVDTGYAYLMRKGARAAGRLQVKTIGDKPVRLEVRTLTASARGEARPESAYTWHVPNDGPFPQLLEVRLTGGTSQRTRKNLRRRTDGEAQAVVVSLTP